MTDSEQTPSEASILATTSLPKKEVVEKAPAPQEQALPVVPIREGVLFPSTESVLTFGRSISLNAIKEAQKTKKMVFNLIS